MLIYLFKTRKSVKILSNSDNLIFQSFWVRLDDENFDKKLHVFRMKIRYYATKIRHHMNRFAFEGWKYNVIEIELSHQILISIVVCSTI